MSDAFTRLFSAVSKKLRYSVPTKKGDVNRNRFALLCNSFGALREGRPGAFIGGKMQCRFARMSPVEQLLTVVWNSFNCRSRSIARLFWGELGAVFLLY